MRPGRQIVRLTYAHETTGFPAILIGLLKKLGYRWYPEYTVYEDYREFNQEQYEPEMVIWDRQDRSITELHTFRGIGVTVEMAVQDAAYAAIVRLHAANPSLEDSVYRYIPYTPAGVDTPANAEVLIPFAPQRTDRSYTAVCAPYMSRRYDPRVLM